MELKYSMKINKTMTIQINFSFNSNLDEKLPELKETALYRILTECINNTLKHAEAKNISINIEKDYNLIYLVYSDDGKGFDISEELKKNSGTGLQNILNRIKSIGGNIKINSHQGKGTMITFCVKI